MPTAQLSPSLDPKKRPPQLSLDPEITRLVSELPKDPGELGAQQATARFTEDRDKTVAAFTQAAIGALQLAEQVAPIIARTTMNKGLTDDDAKFMGRMLKGYAEGMVDQGFHVASEFIGKVYNDPSKLMPDPESRIFFLTKAQRELMEEDPLTALDMIDMAKLSVLFRPRGLAKKFVDPIAGGHVSVPNAQWLKDFPGFKRMSLEKQSRFLHWISMQTKNQPHISKRELEDGILSATERLPIMNASVAEGELQGAYQPAGGFLYHVTPNAEQITTSGFVLAHGQGAVKPGMQRRIGERMAEGLGAAHEAPGVSFMADPVMATHIASQLQWTVRISKLFHTSDPIIQQTEFLRLFELAVREDVRRARSLYNIEKIRERQGASWGSMRSSARTYSQGASERWQMIVDPAREDELIGEIYRQSDLSWQMTRFATAIEPGEFSFEKATGIWENYTRSTRRDLLGIPDAGIYTRWSTLADLDPENVGIVQVPVRDLPDYAAITYNPMMGIDRGEIRVYSDVALDHGKVLLKSDVPEYKPRWLTRRPGQQVVPTGRTQDINGGPWMAERDMDLSGQLGRPDRANFKAALHRNPSKQEGPYRISWLMDNGSHWEPIGHVAFETLEDAKRFWAEPGEVEGWVRNAGRINPARWNVKHKLFNANTSDESWSMPILKRRGTVYGEPIEMQAEVIELPRTGALVENPLPASTAVTQLRNAEVPIAIQAKRQLAAMVRKEQKAGLQKLRSEMVEQIESPDAIRKNAARFTDSIRRMADWDDLSRWIHSYERALVLGRETRDMAGVADKLHVYEPIVLAFKDQLRRNYDKVALNEIRPIHPFIFRGDNLKEQLDEFAFQLQSRQPQIAAFLTPLKYRTSSSIVADSRSMTLTDAVGEGFLFGNELGHMFPDNPYMDRHHIMAYLRDMGKDVINGKWDDLRVDLLHDAAESLAEVDAMREVKRVLENFGDPFTDEPIRQVTLIDLDYDLQDEIRKYLDRLETHERATLNRKMRRAYMGDL